MKRLLEEVRLLWYSAAVEWPLAAEKSRQAPGPVPMLGSESHD